MENITPMTIEEVKKARPIGYFSTQSMTEELKNQTIQDALNNQNDARIWKDLSEQPSIGKFDIRNSARRIVPDQHSYDRNDPRIWRDVKIQQNPFDIEIGKNKATRIVQEHSSYDRDDPRVWRDVPAQQVRPFDDVKNKAERSTTSSEYLQRLFEQELEGVKTGGVERGSRTKKP